LRKQNSKDTIKMHFATTLITAILANTAFAAPAASSNVKSIRAAEPQWTIKSMKRVCNSADTSCAWSFSVDTHLSPVTACAYTVTAASKASQAPANGVTCGPYTVSSGWSGQFGPGNGFTTLAVVNYAGKRIVWPAYTDVQLAGGAVVTPDQSYPPTTLS
jgi:hypothetical protein